MRTAATLAALFALSTATAQDGREPLRGSAVREGGEPWAGATVHLLSRPVANDERFGTPDELTSTTDEKGRFVVQLLPGRNYVAWAVEGLADGHYRASFARENVVGGRPLELIADAPRPRCRLSFEGIAPWRAIGPVIARVFTPTTPTIVVEHALTDDAWLLPPLPCRQGRLEVVCNGQPLAQWPHDVDLRDAQPGPWHPWPPRPLRIRVVDAGGKPVAGAEIAAAALGGQDVRIQERVVGTTGDDGMATVTLPIPTGARFGWGNYALTVTARGFAPVGNISTVEIPADYDVATTAAILVSLENGTSHSVHLHDGDRPFARPVVVVTQPTTSGSGGRLIVPDPHRIAAPDGTGSLDILRHPESSAVVLASTSDLRPPALGRIPLHPLAVVAAIPAATTAAKLDVDLATIVPLHLSVTRDGAPVPAAEVTLLVGHGGDAERALTGILTDRTGRTAVLVPAGTEFTVAAWTDDAFAIARAVTIAKDGFRCALSLQAMRPLPGAVIGKDGRPVAAARVLCSVFGDDQGELAEIGAAIGTLRSETRADGTFVLPMIDGLRCSLSAVVTPDDTHYVNRTWLAGNDEPERIEIDLRNR